MGADNPAVADSLSNLAALFCAQAKYDLAEPLCTRSLAIREKVLGPDNPDVAKALNDLGVPYHVEANDDKAEPLLRRSLAI